MVSPRFCSTSETRQVWALPNRKAMANHTESTLDSLEEEQGVDIINTHGLE